MLFNWVSKVNGQFGFGFTIVRDWMRWQNVKKFILKHAVKNYSTSFPSADNTNYLMMSDKNCFGVLLIK